MRSKGGSGRRRPTWQGGGGSTWAGGSGRGKEGGKEAGREDDAAKPGGGGDEAYWVWRCKEL